MQDFGRSQNVISIAACLPTLTFAENPVPWVTSVNNLTKNLGKGGTLQNRLAFDLPIIVHRVCGYLNLNNNTSCVHI